MKQLNRNFYIVIGVVILLLAGFVYAWSVIAKSIGATYPSWSKAELSMTFTIVMIFFCVGCLVAGAFSEKISSRIYIWMSAILFFAGFSMASVATNTMALYFSFGVLCGLASGIAYNAVMSTISLWFVDKQGLISGILLMGFGISSFVFGKVFAIVAPADGGEAWRWLFKILRWHSQLFLLCAVFLLCILQNLMG